MAGAVQEKGTFRGIARTLLALALLAERTADRSLPIRFIVLAVLGWAETIARTFVAREIETDGWYLEEPPVIHYGAADAGLLGLRLRMLAAILDALADAEGSFGDRSDAWLTRPEVAPRLPVLLLIHLPADRCRPPRPNDTS